MECKYNYNTICVCTIIHSISLHVCFHDFFLWFSFSCLLSNCCMYIIEDFFSLSLCACCTIYFSWCLVSISCSLIFSGNRCFILGCFDALIANLRHNCSLLAFNVSRLSVFSAFSYVLYLWSRIILKAVFCTLSKSFLFFSVRKLCQMGRQ